MPSHHTSQPSPTRPASGFPNHLQQNGYRARPDRCPALAGCPDKAVGYCLATASKSPETGNNAESDWGFRHSARRLVGARVAHKPHSRAPAQAHANRGRMKRAGTHFHVIRLQYHATLIGPILLQAQYQVLKRVLGNFVCFGHGLFPTRIFPDALSQSALSREINHPFRQKQAPRHGAKPLRLLRLARLSHFAE